MQYDLHNNVATVHAISPKTIVNTGSPENLVSPGIDLQFFSSAEVGVYLGDIDELGGSPVGTAKLDVQLEHSDDDSTYTFVAKADTLGALATITSGVVLSPTAKDAVSEVGYIGGKRYIRVTLIPTALTNGGPVAAWVTKGHPRHAPQ